MPYLDGAHRRQRPASHTDSSTGRVSWYQRDELLVAEEDLPHVHEHAHRYLDRHEPLHGAGVVRLRLRPRAGVNVPELVQDLIASHPGRRLAVTANHVLRGEAGYEGGPTHPPIPAAPIAHPFTQLHDPVAQPDPVWPGSPDGRPTPAVERPAQPSAQPTNGAAPMVLHPCPNWPGGGDDLPIAAAPLPRPLGGAANADPWRPSAQPGGQVRVAILDTGISPHPWWDNAPWYVACGPDEREVLDSDGDGVLDREAGHGTFIAGLVLQRAPSAYLLIERILEADGYCDEALLIKGLARLQQRTISVGRPVHVINLSLGGYAVNDDPSPLLTRALGRFGRGTVTVAAAGNNNSEREFWPAGLKEVVAVGALDASGEDRCSFSNYGWWVDACTVGERVTSTFVDFTQVDGTRFDGFATWSGTSFAAPQVAAAVAALAAEHDIRPATALDLLLDRTTNPAMPDFGVIVPPVKSAMCAARPGADSTDPGVTPVSQDAR